MKKKLPVLRFPMKGKAESAERSWHNGGNIEIYCYALSLQQAARTLIEKLELENPRSHWADSPIVLLYRQALELHLKLLVGAGTNFLQTKVDPISLASTHSLRWLAQITGQIIREVGWEKTFKCQGITSLTDFGALVNEVESLEPVAQAIRSSKGRNSVSDSFLRFDVVQFARRLDCLLELLDVTADALAATSEKLSGEEIFQGGDDFKPTIQ